MGRKAPVGGALVAVALAALPACNLMGNEDAEERARLAGDRSRWRGAGISDYAYEVRKLCFCPPEVVGHVRGGSALAAGLKVCPGPDSNRHELSLTAF